MRERGLTLIELLVAMVIALVVTLAVTSAVIFGESTKRTTTSVNDINQSGSYAAYLLDRAVRSAGSGFTQSWDLGVFGCKLQAKRSNTAILPRTTVFPVPFEKFLGNATGVADLRVAPLLIGKGQSSDGKSDVLMVMGGNAASGDVPRPIISAGASDNIVRLDNTVQLKKNDIALVSQVGTTDCLLEQVDSSFVDSANNELATLNGTYYTAGVGTTLASLAASGSAYFTPLGNGAANNVQFQLFSIGANNTLVSYDLLRSDGTDAPQTLADGVMEMHALYGLDTNTDGIIDTWKAPDATGFDISTMMKDGKLSRQVVAVRVGLILRSATLERDLVSQTIPEMFSDTGLKRDAVTLTNDDRRYRYRVVEFTIPLRNILLLPKS
ncbi:PilW family protein [Variovorax paradoxus]|uniref:PilW family protein n=1 Tax=Variovorax paradoxus TaxID=34073 RepID=UPI00215E3E4A|nr:PilW family protein [Variovorax paradoxus]UVH57618.1 PilW family protein [Variovorax paradoxus]